MNKLGKIFAVLMLLTFAATSLVGASGVELIRSKWVSGNLVYTDKSGNALLTISPTTVEIGSSATLKVSGSTVPNEYVVSAYLADAGTAGSAYVVCPYAGTIKKLSVVNYAANAGTKTVLLGKIGGSNVTAPAFEEAVTAAAGTGVTVVPTAANVVTAGQVLEFATDGGSSSVTPVNFQAVIQR